MPSYADVAASGPKQTPEEARAHAVPTLEHTTSDEVHSTIDVDSPHISSVPSTYTTQEIKTDTQAERLSHEAADKERRAEREASRAAEAAKQKAKQAVEAAKRNPQQTVLFGNAAVVGVMAVVLGVGAYRKYARGEMSWGVAGFWAGIVGLVGLGDAVVSRLFLQRNE